MDANNLNDVHGVQATPYKGNDPYIFVSYSHKDTDRIMPMLYAMQKDGYRIWFDEGIDPGTEWDQNIAAHIENCGYFIAFLSEHYMQSDNCKDELNFARDLNKHRVLIYLEQVTLPAGMAMRLNRLQAIHYYVYPSQELFLKKLYAADKIQSFRTIVHEKSSAQKNADPAPDQLNMSMVRSKEDQETKAPKKSGQKKRLAVFAVISLIIVGLIVATVMRLNNSPFKNTEELETSANANYMSGIDDESDIATHNSETTTKKWNTIVQSISPETGTNLSEPIKGYRIWFDKTGLYLYNEEQRASNLLYKSSVIETAAFDGVNVMFAVQDVERALSDEKTGACSIYMMDLLEKEPVLITTAFNPAIIFFDSQQLFLKESSPYTGEQKLSFLNKTDQYQAKAEIATIGNLVYAMPVYSNGYILYSAGAQTYDGVGTLYGYDLETHNTKELAQEVTVYQKSIAVYGNRVYYKTYSGIGSVRFDGTDQQFYELDFFDKNSAWTWGNNQIIYNNPVYNEGTGALISDNYYLYTFASQKKATLYAGETLENAYQKYGEDSFVCKGVLYYKEYKSGILTLYTYEENGEISLFKKVAMEADAILLDITNTGVYYSIGEGEQRVRFSKYQ